MKTKKIKYVLLLLCSTLLLPVTPTLVLAGSIPVVETDSGTAGQGDGFAAEALTDQSLAVDVSIVLMSTLQTVVDQGQVDLGITRLPLTEEEIQAFDTLLSNDSDRTTATDFLVDQISEDIGVEVDIEVVAATAANLELVVNQYNNLMASLNTEQLRAAYVSAPLQAILQSLRVAVSAADDNDSDDLSDVQLRERGSFILLELP